MRDATARPETGGIQNKLANPGLPLCRQLTVWKHSHRVPGRYGGHYTAHYCDEHLPDEYRQHLPSSEDDDLPTDPRERGEELARRALQTTP